MTPDFQEFKKIPRLNREVVVTEKIDGTNACIVITPDSQVYAQSRSRFVVPGKQDNFGFAAWVHDNTDELLLLGEGYHFGEWWGRGIQRGYGQEERRFSLFNAGRWTAENVPPCVSVVPIICSGLLRDGVVENSLNDLRQYGSTAAPGYMHPEGVIVYHTAGGHYYKVLLENDEGHKGG